MIIMTGDFNIRDSDWNPNFQHHSTHTEDLLTITDSLGLELSSPLNPGPTRYVDNTWDSNSIIDSVFLPPDNRGFSQHMLYSNICKPSNHVPLTIEVDIAETNTDLSFRSISKDSEEEEKFIELLISGFSNINSSTITTKKELEGVVQQMANTFERSWDNHAKLKHITKHLKECLQKQHQHYPGSSDRAATATHSVSS